ncbi:MAG: aldolase [Acidobacteriota bacterium]
MPEVGAVIVSSWDPLMFRVELPREAAFHPLGFPLHLSTNSAEIAKAAEESWGGFPPMFPGPPIQLRVAVDEDGPAECASGMVMRGQKHLVTMIADERNFAVCDLAQAFAFCWVTAATARNRPWFRYYFLDTIALLILWHSHLTRIHAGCVALNGRGVLFCGAPGAGKSCLTYACARRGWTFISDEAPSLLRRSRDRIVLGKPQQIHLRESAFELFPELNGRAARPNPVGKLTFEINTADLPNIRTAFRCRADALVFLNRQPGPTRLTPLPKDEVWRRLIADLPFFEQPAHAEHEASLANLLQAATFEICYEDPHSAAEELERMVREEVG